MAERKEAGYVVKDGVKYWLKDEKARELIEECYSPSNPPPVVPGVPSGGTTGQVLKKHSDTDYDMEWAGESGSVISVNGKTGAVTLDADDVGALPDTYVAPVQSVNGQVGAVSLSIPDSTSDLINDSGFITAAQAPVQSVNGQTGAVNVGTIAVQDNAPSGGELVWVDTDEPGVNVTIPQIDDTSVSADDTWSSQKIRDFIYPIGSIYMSVNSTSPATIFGGTWEQIEDTFLLAAGSTYSAGDTGGKANYVAADMPKHSHTRGTMNITGEWSINDDSGNAGLDAPNSGSGAISAKNGTGYGSDNAGSGSWNVTKGFKFNAASAWSGSTSEVGTNTTAEILPPYLAVYVWKRTA